MASRTIGNIKLVYGNKEAETAELIGDACEKSVRLAREGWGLESPDNCRIYVMTSWAGFLWQSTPLSWKMLLPLTMPFWFPRVTRAWRYSAAWTQNYGRRIAIGVKPARIIEKTDRSVGIRIYAEEKNPDNNIRQVACHEIVHACSAHLRLPMWLNEGIAVVTADRFMEKPTIREDTLQYMKDYTPKKAPPTYQELSRMDDKAIAYNLTRSYWLAHYLEKEHPGLIRSLLEKRMEPDIITSRIAGELGIEQKDFWKEIDGIVTEYFTEGQN